MSRIKSFFRIILIFLLFSLASLVTRYPYISNYIYDNRADSLVGTVEEKVENIPDVELSDMLIEANKYNLTIASGHVKLTDPFVAEKLGAEAGDYNKLLNMTPDGVMGSVEIPVLDVHLPIYHGTSDSVLEKGVGHLLGTSLPVGGPSTHSVLTGHSGLSNAKLFTDLEELEKGDYFFLNVCGKRLAYKVDDISKVLPEEMNKLQVYPNKDYCTLVTCTPYGVNTHRLLVRGIATDYKEAEEKAKETKPKKVESKWMKEYKEALKISLSVFIVSLTILLIYRKLTGTKPEEMIDDFK